MSIKYGLIAAGKGSRLVSEGITTPKPLVKVCGEELIGRLLRLFVMNDASSISIIINEEMTEVYDYLMSLTLPVPLNLIVRSTPDSFQSFCALKPYLMGEEKFCLTTVDPIFRDDEFSEYVKDFVSSEDVDALMGVTGYVDDEKPLYVITDENMSITDYSNVSRDDCKFISGGVYCMNHNVLDLLSAAVDSGVARMRGFQKFIVDAGLKVKAWQFPKVIDIDHASDIQKAEQYLTENIDK